MSEKLINDIEYDAERIDKIVQKELIDIGLNSANFNGHRLLKKCGEKIPYTPKHIEEYKKCAENPVYFAENYVYIINIERGREKIELYDYQKEMIENFAENRFNVVLSSRQSGKTTVTSTFLLWFILFHSDKSVGILANKARTAQMIVNRMQLSYTLLPKWLQQGVTDWNKQSFALENGSRILSAATSSDSIRGESLNCLYIDEVAFIQESVFSEFFRSVYPTISSSKKSKIILVSTPNGDNFFHSIWKKAKDGVNGYVPFQVNWWDVPGRDEKWKEEQIAATDEITFNQEFGCDFNTTTTTLIPYDKINYIETNAIKPINFNNSMKIYKNPQKNHTYVLSCDVADQGIDFSVVTVIDITEYPWEQVCVYRENISYIMFPPVIMHIASMYNNGYVLVENNDVGKTILHVLNYEYELENIISTSVASGRGRPSNRYELGQRTTIKTKALGCSQFKQLVVSNKIKINNDWTIQEIKHFSVDSKGSYSSDTPTVHDDCVMTLVNFSYFSTTPTYKLLFDKDVGEDIRAEEERMIEESLLPLPMESRNINDSEWTADEIKWVNE